VTPTLVKTAPARPVIRPQLERKPNTAAILAIILACYLMIVLDISVVIAALPKIQSSLHFSATSLSWVQSAYTLSFGGLLLLGARAGDILGRRRMLISGIVLFTLASLAGGLAPSAEWLLGARAVQGIGAALAAPSTLALLTTTFREGPERTRAIAYYSAVAGGGGSVGLVLGGMLTDWISWRWGLFINVPVGIAIVLLAPRFLPETERRSGRFDLTGALTSTFGMTALVYGFVRAASDGWSERFTVASFAAGVLLLAAFAFTEKRAEQPITPLHLFASRQRSGAYVARILVTGGMFSAFFFMTQFLQGVDGFTPLQAGLAFLPMTVVMFSMGRIVPSLIRRFGNTAILIAGLVVAVVGLSWLSRVSAGTDYFPHIAVPLAILGTGIGIAFAPLTTAGIAGVAQGDAGAASGLLNVSQQLGASLGLGILITVFAAARRATDDLGAKGELAHAVGTALTGSAIFLAIALAVVVFVIRRPSRETAKTA
jgi:EmrB/QacA subfamily drug resistance transporter